MKNFVEFDLKKITINETYANDPEYASRFKKLNRHIQKFKWPGNISDYECDTNDEYISEQLDNNMAARKLVESSNTYANILQTKIDYFKNLYNLLDQCASKNDYSKYDIVFKSYLDFERKRKLAMLFGVLTVTCVIGAVIAGIIWIL